MKLRKIWALALASILLLPLAGAIACDRPKDTGNLPSGGQPIYQQKLTYTMNIVNSDIIGKGQDGEPAANFTYFCKKFNIAYDFWPVNWTDWYDKVRIWTSSGDMPDILFMDIGPARFSEYATAARQGVLRALPPFEGKYPHLQQYIEPLESVKYLTIDGKLYTLPRSRESQQFNNASSWAYVYRRDWAEKLGLAHEDNIYTWDEWRGLLKAFVDQDPGGNGPGRTIGIGGPLWSLPKFFGGGCINPYFLTYTRIGDRYVWGPTMPESLELVKTFQQMLDDGVIWRDMLLGRDMDSGSQYSASLMGAMPYSSSVSGLEELRMDFATSNPDVPDVKKATSLAMVRGLDGKIYVDQTEDFWSSFSFDAGIDDEKLDRMLEAFDWITSQEGTDFVNYGIPGVDWEKNNDRVTLKWKPNPNGTLQYPYLQSSEYWMMGGLKDNDALQSPAYPDDLKHEVLDFLQRRQQSDCNLVPYDYKVLYFDGPVYTATSLMENQIIGKLADLMLGSKDIEADWKQWLKSMEPTYRPVEEELTRELNKP